MNYPVYNPYINGQYAYGQYGPQQGQQGPIMPQSVNPQAPMQGQQQAVQGLSQASRPVTSREEAMGVAADFSGALMVFPDITHDRVYIKRWNFQTGASDFIEFTPIIQPPAQQEQPCQQADMFASIQDLKDLQGTVENLRQEIDKLKRPQAAAKAPAKREKGEANE